MKILRLYSNRDEFSAITFNTGLSVVYAEIRVPANRSLDTHNLGKTTVGQLLDYCLLRGKSQSFFLFKHQSLFGDFWFYLDVQLDSGGFLTIGRPVAPGSRVWFKRRAEVPDGSLVPPGHWDHENLPFERAKLLLDAFLDIEVIRPWGFRKLVGYLIRSQADYLDVFQLGKFSGKHQDWKPFVAHLLGMQAQSAIDLYAKREEIEASSARLATLSRELGTAEPDLSVIDGLISVQRRDLELRSRALESFNFEGEDRRQTQSLVEDVEEQIAGLNEQAYRLAQLIQRLNQSLEEEQIMFSPAEAQALFSETQVLFPEGLAKTFDQLIAFNRAISAERRESLEQQLRSSVSNLERVRAALSELNDRRARSLGYLRESESLEKFRELSRNVSVLQGNLAALEIRRESTAKLVELRQQRRALEDEYGQLETAVEEQIDELSRTDESRFGKLRTYFSEIINDVLGQSAILSVRLNSAGGLDFSAEFVGDSGVATSGDRGTSYKKLMCIAFDLAMLRAYVDEPFPRFVYHDGALEQLEPRKRANLIQVFRQYSELGLQPIISVLDSDLPQPLDASADGISSRDVVRRLHDEGDDGRLFTLPAW